MASEHFHEHFWDYLYGLLDEPEAQHLRAHVAECAACRQSLAETEAQRQTLGRAARILPEVPAFTLPGQDLAATDVSGPAEVAAVPGPGLLPTSSSPRRAAPWRRFGLAFAAAAALLGVAFGLNEVYRGKLAEHEAEVARIRNEVATVDGKFASLQTNLEKQKQEKARTLKRQLPPQVQIVGPSQVLPGAPLALHVTARDLDGKGRAEKIRTIVKEAATGKVLHEQTDRVAGEGSIQVPGLGISGEPAALTFVPERGQAVNGTIRVAEAVYVSHLALNKSLYYIGDVLFFRSLTLERYSLTPPKETLSLRFALIDANGRIVKELPGQTGPGGISAGEMALTPELVSGSYTFQVSAAVGSSAGMLPQTMSIEIVRDDSPQFAFDRNQYRAGDKINYNFTRGQQTGNNNGYSAQPVTITLNADGQHVQQNNSANKAQTSAQSRPDNAGNISGELQLPQRVVKAEIVAEFGAGDGKASKKVVQPIPVVPTEKTIDFFPEGGDLVAGVSNRVYYRVRSPRGEPVDPDGHVIILASKAVLHDSERHQSLGWFTFTPDPKEKYSVRITGADSVTEIRDPFQKLGIKTDGIVLHAPEAVVQEGEPLKIVLRNPGSSRRLWLQTVCRGQVLDQQYVESPRGNLEVKLQPVPGAAGVLRVTALEGTGARLVPIAERLLYRAPAKRLDVSCEITNGPGPYTPGTPLTLKVKTLDEGKKPGPIWMSGMVVDEKFRADKHERGLEAHFTLASEFDGDEVDSANLVLTDAAASRRALDLFLGTQGWRRFVAGPNVTLMAANSTKDAKGASGGPPAGPDSPIANSSKREKLSAALGRSSSFFSIENTSVQSLELQYQAALQKELSELADQANRERAELLEQKEVRVQVLGQAVHELAELQQLPGALARLFVGILTLGLLTASVVFLALGLFRALRKTKASPTPCLAVAFSGLLTCLILYFAAGGMPVDSPPGPSLAMGPSVAWPEFTPEPVKPAATGRAERAGSKSIAAAPPVGSFSAAAPEQELKKAAAAPRSAPAAAADALDKRADGASRAQTFGLNQLHNLAQAEQRQLRTAVQDNEELRRRYAEAESKAKQQTAAPQMQPAQPKPALKTIAQVPGGLAGAKKADEDKAPAYYREYAHRLPRQAGRLDFQDTLLWHPVLFSPDGSAQFSFDLAHNVTTYRILFYANSSSGRLGFFEGHFDVRPAVAK